jgi:hypothetical protein
MSTQLQLRRGTTAQTAIFTGAVAEVTVDTDKNTLVIHDGVTQGGHYITGSLTHSLNTIYSDNQNIVIATGNPSASPAMGMAWTLGTDGNLTLPANGDILFANSVSALDSIGAANTIAYNALGLAESANNTAFQALDKATDADANASIAFSKASDADANAANAIITALASSNTSLSASNSASFALNVANLASANAANAVILAQNANDNASNAANTASLASANAGIAFSTSVNALSLANNAYNLALDANNAAVTSNSYATEAITLANSAYILSNSAYNLALAANNSLDVKFDKVGGTISGDTTITANLSITGNLSVTGNVTTTDINNVSLSNSIIYLARDNPANTVDIGFVGSFTEGTYQHTGLVRDNSDGKWKFFSGVTTEPNSTIDFNGATYDTILVGGVETQDLKSNNITANTFMLNDSMFYGNSVQFLNSNNHLHIHNSTLTTIHGNTDIQGTFTVNGQPISGGGGGGTSYDQSLNTTDNVIFRTATVNGAFKVKTLSTSQTTRILTENFDYAGGGTTIISDTGIMQIYLNGGTGTLIDQLLPSGYYGPTTIDAFPIGATANTNAGTFQVSGNNYLTDNGSFVILNVPLNYTPPSPIQLFGDITFIYQEKVDVISANSNTISFNANTINITPYSSINTTRIEVDANTTMGFVNLDTLDNNTNKTAKYIIQAVCNTQIHCMEVLLASNVGMTEYATIKSANDLIQLNMTTDYTYNQSYLWANNISSNSNTVITVHRTLLVP